MSHATDILKRQGQLNRAGHAVSLTLATVAK